MFKSVSGNTSHPSPNASVVRSGDDGRLDAGIGPHLAAMQALVPSSLADIHVGSDPDSRGLLLEAMSHFVTMIENSSLMAILSFDRNGVVHLWNSASAALYQIAVADAVGKSMRELLSHPAREQEFSAAVQQIWDTGLPTTPTEWQVTTRSGRALWVYSTMLPVFRQGVVSQILRMDVDITERKRIELSELMAKEGNFHALFDRSADAILQIKETRFLDLNPAAQKLFGYVEKHNLVGRFFEDISPPRQPDGKASYDKARAMLRLALQKGNHRFEWQYLDSRHEPFWCEVLITAIPIDHVPLLYAVVRDISKRKSVQQSLHLAARVFQNSREAILITDRYRRIMSVNEAFTEITGFRPDEVIGKKTSTLRSGLQDPAFYQGLWDQVAATDHWQGESMGRRKDGPVYPQWLSITAVRNHRHQVCNYIAIFSDISERKATEGKIRHIAEHDFLTGLPNRLLLLDRLGQAIGTAERARGQLAILFLDLDRFKNINDTMGHHIGDKLLQVVAERLRKCVRSVDTVSRQGGDEFVILLINPGGHAHAAHIAANILRTMAMPCQIDNYEIVITTCIGISVYPGDGLDMDTLIKNADTAMYHAKQSGRNGYQFFNDDMNLRIVERTSMENSLKQALAQGDFFLEYQPVIDIASGRIIGAEALLRWHHPQLGLLSPARFIPIAEDCGLINPIGDWVLRTACQQAKTWLDEGMPMVVSVNMSVSQFRQKDLLQSVIDILQQTGLDPQYLGLEITEAIVMGPDRTVEIMKALHELGVKLAIDDFGTGFSSLSHLKRFSIDKLKIDQSFVRDISNDPDDTAIISAIIAMAKNLNLKVIAEGVETAAQLDFLRAHGCDEYQGHYFSKPLAPENLARLRTPLDGSSPRH